MGFLFAVAILIIVVAYIGHMKEKGAAKVIASTLIKAEAAGDATVAAAKVTKDRAVIIGGVTKDKAVEVSGIAIGGIQSVDWAGHTAKLVLNGEKAGKKAADVTVRAGKVIVERQKVLREEAVIGFGNLRNDIKVEKARMEKERKAKKERTQPQMLELLPAPEDQQAS